MNFIEGPDCTAPSKAFEGQSKAMNTPIITMGKKYQTRGSLTCPSRPVRIVSVDRRGGSYCVVGLIKNGGCGDEDVEVWKIDGTRENYTGEDLVPVPVQHEGWLVVFPGEPRPTETIYPYIFSSKAVALNYQHSDTRLGHVVLVTWVD
jgi:hypothetical protein